MRAAVWPPIYSRGWRPSASQAPLFQGSIFFFSARGQGSLSFSKNALESNESTTVGDTSSSSSSSSSLRYRRRSSDPQTKRERMNFSRDYHYAKHRPLPDVPWRQQREKTYLDDAERLYGQKETWHLVSDAVLREKLVSILLDYIGDTVEATRLEVRHAKKYQRSCRRRGNLYRASVLAGSRSSPELLKHWATSVTAAHGSGSEQDSLPSFGADSAISEVEREHYVDTSSPAPTTEAEREAQDQRRRRGERASLENTPAAWDLPETEVHQSPQSGFPFLRQRAVEGEHTLDPSLVDWAAKYYPEDNTKTFSQPPQLRTGAGSARETPREVSGESGATQYTHRPGPANLRMHARERLSRNLREHDNARRATFDAEGVFYHVRPPSEEDEKVPQPKALRGSDMVDGDVVKVPWNVVATAQKQGYTSDILRAKERLVRLTRGEDPSTIP